MVKNAAENEEESLYKASFNISEDLIIDLSIENKTMPSAYRRILKSEESIDEQIGDMYMLKSNGIRQLILPFYR